MSNTELGSTYLQEKRILQDLVDACDQQQAAQHDVEKAEKDIMAYLEELVWEKGGMRKGAIVALLARLGCSYPCKPLPNSSTAPHPSDSPRRCKGCTSCRSFAPATLTGRTWKSTAIPLFPSRA